MTVINIPARDPQKAIYSWYIVTREEINGKRIAVWAPHISDEALTRRASTPTHPVDRQGSIMDDAILENFNYSVTLRYNTMLEGDRPLLSVSNATGIGSNILVEFTDFFKLLTGFDGTLVSYPPTISGTDMLGFIRFAQEGVLKIQGLPVDIYSPKFGLLENFVMAGYNDTRGLASSANMQLSFIERRVSESETVVIDTSAIKAREAARRRAAKAKKEAEEKLAEQQKAESDEGGVLYSLDAATGGYVGDYVSGLQNNFRP